MIKLKERHQKNISLAILVFLGVTVLYFGLRAMPAKLIKPFDLLPPGSSGINFDKEARARAELLAMKLQDTDNDGLSDYDELYLYRTSPYLADTDSDGIFDKEEIERGSDPNCPEGVDCRLAFTLPSAQEQSQEKSKEALIPKDITAGTPLEEYSDILLFEKLALDLPAETIRSLLLEQGFPKEELEKIDDQTLRQLWRETFNQYQQDSSRALQELSVPAPAIAPSSGELRRQLLEAGLDPSFLEQLSDEELLKMYEELSK